MQPVKPDHKPVEKDTDYVLQIRREMLTGFVVFGAILLFVSTGSTILADAVHMLRNGKSTDDNILAAAFLLNIALILFGWRRYRDLQSVVQERTAAEKRAMELADTDPLTGYFNRRAVADRATELIAEARKQQRQLACLMLDIDNFKTINDVHGHSAGDAVLRELSTRFENCLPNPRVLARLGGDEFACLFIMPHENPEAAENICEDLINSTQKAVDHAGQQLIVTCSIGISILELGEEIDVDALMARADMAMYSAKKRGRNRYCWFDLSMQTKLKTRNNLETSMRRGIANGEFVPFFEQQINLETGQLAGFEMLARWFSPEHGIVSPEVFIPIAEETGMIGDLSLSIMRQSFEEARNWNSDLILSVNISPVQLHDPWLAQKIVKALVETGYPPERLEIEITESSLFENLSLAQSTIGSLKNQGIRIALDDFGTGYSSLAHLRALPFDRIKIDRSFVTSINSSTDSDAIVRSIVSLGQSLKIPVTAEGIENEGIIEKLLEIGCSKGQGFHFGRPLRREDAHALLAERGLLSASTAEQAPVEPNVIAPQSIAS